MKLLIINGPNLNLTGQREKSIYGHTGFQAFLEDLKKTYAAISFDYFQSNHAGELIDKLQDVDGKFDGIILNAGAFTHTSLALGDAVASMRTHVIEVHMSNTLSRESIRHKSYIGPHCTGIIMGFGLESYKLATDCFIRMTHLDDN